MTPWLILLFAVLLAVVMYPAWRDDIEEGIKIWKEEKAKRSK